nr:MAG TPA: hypothetical protein [Caudoviricetes sp.]
MKLICFCFFLIVTVLLLSFVVVLEVSEPPLGLGGFFSAL